MVGLLFFFFLFHMDSFFSVKQIKCSLSAATLPCQILYFSEECFMFSSWHISILMQLLHFYSFQFYRVRLCLLVFYTSLMGYPTYYQPYQILFQLHLIMLKIHNSALQSLSDQNNPLISYILQNIRYFWIKSSSIIPHMLWGKKISPNSQKSRTPQKLHQCPISQC